MNINSNDNYVNFGALRVTTGLSEAGKKADQVCHRIFRELNPGGITGSGEYHAMFFRNKIDEAKATKILHDANVPYTRSDLADIADRITQQEWAQTGDPLILNKWYMDKLKNGTLNTII